MATNEVTRNYKMADDMLWQKADTLEDSMRRDFMLFKERNIDVVRIDEMAAKNASFKEFPTDVELLGTVTTLTEVKDATALVLRQRLSTVRSMAATKYKNIGKFKTFGFGELSALPDTELLRTSKRVVRVGTRFLTELTTEGLTPLLLAEITELGTRLDNDMDAMEEAIEERDIKTQERIIAGNALWELMVKYADVGKSLFEFTDEARYNDYVLTEAAPSGNVPPPPPI